MDADADPDRQPRARELLEDLQVDLVGLASPAELLVEGQRQQTRLAERAEYVARESTGLLIGRDPNFNDRRFNGGVDEVAIWDRSLSTGEVLSGYEPSEKMRGLVSRILQDWAGADPPER